MKRFPIYESIPVGLLLAVAGGIMDGYTYLNRGQVFATMETGNLIMMGLNLSQGRLDMALHYVLPILAFACGVLFTELVCRRLESRLGALGWRRLLVTLELLALLLIAALPLGRLDWFCNILISFTAAIQVESFRSIYGCPCATTMCTGNLRSGMEQLFRFLCGAKESGKKALFYLVLIGSFFTGVIASSLLTPHFGGRTILFSFLFLLLALLLMSRNEKNT